MESIRKQVTKNSDGGFSLKDSNIHFDDIQSLDDGECVNDMVIHYYLRLLELKYDTQKLIQFVMPCTIQFIQAFPIDIVRESLSSEFFEGFRYFILPISNFNTQSLSSSHWSLLIVSNSPEEGLSFYHFDSMFQSNVASARQLAQAFSDILSIQTYQFNAINSDSQTNNYDCGVYVMAYIKSFLDNKCNINKVTEGITPEATHRLRHQVKKDILDSFPK